MKLRFTIIDDSEEIRNLFCLHLTRMGHEVVCAEHPLAEPVCQKAQCTNDDACADGYFVDFSMPHMTGLHFFQSLLKRGCKSPPENRFLMSANLPEDAMKKASELRITYVRKPFRLKRIEELVEEAQIRLDLHLRRADLQD